jgi:hypothetical protein
MNSPRPTSSDTSLNAWTLSKVFVTFRTLTDGVVGRTLVSIVIAGNGNRFAPGAVVPGACRHRRTGVTAIADTSGGYRLSCRA